ncbi:hypothetical protein H4Q32_025635 [Labeo rohita]|uniref:DDE Tnp4 domain-containing protein n=1 Tax=Labeo rohita TaxID=84645 RepID=A0ABQ8LJG3_LABRO|nr:hypothetical protein H4Q32_025635 [Labeo rohita]
MDYLDYVNDDQRFPPARQVLADRKPRLSSVNGEDNEEDSLFRFVSRTQANYKVLLYEYGNFPGVIGCIDGTHIPIKRPSTLDAEEYRNRKNWFSINVQGVCTPHGYAQKDFLFTPYLHPTTAEQLRYNQAHMRTRGLVERMFGVWKSRFQCLRKTLRFKPSRCCTVITATAVLHNYLKKQGCPDPPTEEDDNPDVPPFTTNHREGLAYRDAFALCHFK